MTTMRWFGHPYNAPAWAEALEVPVPVGEPCITCTRVFTTDDDGITLPELGTEVRHPYHVRCFLDSIVPGAVMPPRSEGTHS